ncbi:hypothetical protein [Lysobacter niastensis]|uniref:Uncharacterized protein n=1 Tax=Lysobacter niastensis TaxID=380629 RepID=A0ABS0B4G0_9GAMM|nr:hypothetical protein [Lysobacter niastensis]MBF6023506.1 hypothetical protein [Lysobacter niastensis]
MNRFFLLLPTLTLALWVSAAVAQNTVIQAENVRFDYAQVLRVTPVYQTLRASSVEQQCEGDEDSRLSRVVGKVKDALTREDKGEKDGKGSAAANCKPVTVEREFRRPIAYDVDYVYKGSKFRSRLPEDPGNRLRIRVSVTPVVAPARSR